LPEPGLYIVRDPEDLPSRASFLRQLSDPVAGRVVCEIRPGARGKHWVAAAVLEGLGKDIELGTIGRSATRMLERAADWLIGYRVTDLFVSRCQIVTSREWQLLAELSAETNARLWLIVQQEHLRRRQRELTQSWPFTSRSWEAFEKEWSAVAASEPTDEAQPSPNEANFPAIPEDDFTTFLATSRRVIRAPALSRVEEAFNLGRGRIAEALAGGESWQSSLRRLVEEARARDEAITRIRGAQAGAFLEGRWLRLDLRLFGLRWETQVARELTPPLLAALAAFPSAQWSAVAAVSVLTGATPAEVAALPLDSVDDDVIELGGQRWSLPPAAAAFLQAQAATRAREGAELADPLFRSDDRSGGSRQTATPLAGRGAQRILRRIGNLIGLELVERKSEPAREDDETWARRRGLSLRFLEALDG
jgi:hypothetical protein